MGFVFAAALSIASAKWTCEDCNAVVNSMAEYLTSEESVLEQMHIMLSEVCPQLEESRACAYTLPAFWKKVAMVLWPGYYEADADWMCAPLCVVGAEVRGVTCEKCFVGIQKKIDQLLSEPFIQGIVDALSGDGFCGTLQGWDPEDCAAYIASLIPVALPAVVANLDPSPIVCNNAIPDTCPAL